MRRLPLKLSILALLSGCSIFNREGPNVSCGDLGGGTKNACANGIIATCTAGKVTYRVCDLDNVCEQSWQTEGQYRCDQNSPLPDLRGSAGTGGQAPGSGGGSGLPGSGGGSGGSPGSGGVPATGATGGAGGQLGCSGGPCAIGSTGQSTVDAMALDTQNVYFSDCTTLWSVAKSGGFATVLSAQLAGCSKQQMTVDGQYVYVAEYDLFSERIVRVPTAGGARAVVVTASSGQLGAMAATGGNVFWADDANGGIVRVNANTGATDQATTTSSIGPRLLVASGNLLWCYLGSLSRLPTTGPFPSSPSSVSIGRNCDDFAVAADGTAVYIDGPAKVVGLVTAAGQVGSDLVTGLSGLRLVAIDAVSVYYTVESASTEIRKVPRGGGTVQRVATLDSGLGAILLVDDQYVYWTAGSSVMRATK